MALDPFTFFYFASSAYSYGQQKKAKREAEILADQADHLLLNTSSNNAPIPVIYGERRVGGTLVYKDTGVGTEYLYYALVLCEGEVESITDIEIDESPITSGKFSGYVDYNVHLGADDQQEDALIAGSILDPLNTISFRLQGIAYIALRFKYNSNVFDGQPTVTAVVKGKKVYDPRSNTTAYSTNPALCLRDYLTNTRYGKGLSTDRIDDVAFATAANDCDQVVTFYTSGTTGKLFECNTVLDTDNTVFDNVSTLLMGMRGFLPYTQGKYALKIDKATSSIFDFTEEHILSGIKISGEQKENQFNRVILSFPNPEANWQADNAIWPDAESTEEAAYLAEDGVELVNEMQLETITNYYAARDLARILVLRSRNSMRCALTVTSEGFQVGIADVVTITHPTPDWTQKPFQVEQIALNNDGTCSLQLIEYDSSIYTYDTAAEQQSYPDSNLPDAFSIEPPTNLTATGVIIEAADGSITSAIDVTWTAADDAFVSSYEVTTTDSSGNVQAVPVAGTRYRLANLDSALTYTIAVKSINVSNVKSAAVTVSSVPPVIDTTAPSAPTNGSVEGALKQIILSWTNPTDADFSHIEIKRSSTSVETDAVYIDKTVSNSYADAPFALPATRFYWIRSVDRTGNASVWVSIGSATSTVLAPSDFSDGVIYFDLDNLDQSTQDAVNSIGAIESDVNSLTSTVNGQTATINSNTSSINGVTAQYAVTVDNNGNVSGFGLMSTLINGGAGSIFKVAADQFAIAGSGSASQSHPFVVYTQDTSVTVDGQAFTIPAGTYIDSARINYLSANSITTGTISANRIDLDEDTITAGTNGIEIKDLSVDTIKIKDQAISIPVATFSDQDVILYQEAAYITAILKYESTGNPVYITWNSIVTETRTGGTAPTNFYVRRVNNTTNTYSVGDYAVSTDATILSVTDISVNGQQTISGSTIDEPSAGGITYLLMVMRNYSTGSSGGFVSSKVSSNFGSLSVVELKK